MKPIGTLIPFGIFAVVGATYLYVSPYATLFFLSRTLRQDDAKAVESYLDVPALRESLRSQIREHIEFSSKSDGFNSGWTEFAKGIGGSLTESCVVRATSADGITRILRTGVLDLCDPSPADSKPLDTGFNGAKLKYLSFDKFIIDLPSDGENQLRSFELTRRNLFDWKITSARFDLNTASDSGQPSVGKIACGKQITNIEQSILTDEKIPIANLQKSSIDSPFQDRSHEYAFMLGGQDGYFAHDDNGTKKINALFADPAKLPSLARRVIESCPDIAVVSFARYGGGYRLSWYFSQDGIFMGECVDPSVTEPAPRLEWGQHFCT